VDFRAAFEAVTQAMRAEGVDFALIGGFALAALGCPRATGDIDFLIAGEHADRLARIMQRLGYAELHRSGDAANYAASDIRLGRVDVLYARRQYSRAMLARACPYAVLGETEIKVVEAEDLIGLKVQSSTNNPKRRPLDLSDIEQLLATHPGLDVQRVREYFRLFDREAELDAILARSQP
jgi:Uncharacterised nucleotidyltransferase